MELALEHPPGGQPTGIDVDRQLLIALGHERARARLVAGYDHERSQHDFLLGYRWDIVLTGSHATLMERAGNGHA